MQLTVISAFGVYVSLHENGKLFKSQCAFL